ncbi:MAG: hypothetical protein ACI4NM_09490 [Bullifex sp.]
MSKKYIAVILLSLIIITPLFASGADINYYPVQGPEMVLESIPGVSGKSGILLGCFEVKATNNSQFTINFSRPDVYKDIIFIGKADGNPQQELAFDLFYTWDGDNQFRSGTYDGSGGIDIRVFKQNGETCYLKIYLKVDKDISKLSGIYELKDKTGLPQITVTSISIKDKNFSLTVNGQPQSDSSRTPVAITGSTPLVDKGNSNIVPGVSTDKGSNVMPVTPFITTEFLDPYTGIELDRSTYNLDMVKVLNSFSRTPVTQLRLSITNSDGSSSAVDFGDDYRYLISISSDGALTDSSGRMIPYTLITDKLSESGLSITGSDAQYILSDLKTFGTGRIGIYFSFADQQKLLNAPAGTYTDTITVTVTNTY